VWAGEAWYVAHRKHVYQRLTDRGWSHQRVTGVTVTVAAIVGAGGFAASTASAPMRVTLVAAGAAVLIAYLAAPAWLAALGSGRRPVGARGRG
jgi:hypothetical protein